TGSSYWRALVAQGLVLECAVVLRDPQASPSAAGTKIKDVGLPIIFGVFGVERQKPIGSTPLVGPQFWVIVVKFNNLLFNISNFLFHKCLFNTSNFSIISYEILENDIKLPVSVIKIIIIA